MLAQTPPMGFNTWNTFGTNISDIMIRETADAFIANGLKEAGYEYLVIDDCWSERERDAVTGKIVPDKIKFPNGMKAVSDYVHSKGLKFGIYSCAGLRTCADYPGSFDHEYLDAETFAEYGCDFLKYDFCYKPDLVNGPLLYHRMGLALRACGREIMFSACNWGSDDVWTWIRSTGAHMYRSTGDINDSYNSFRDIALSQVDKLGFSAPGCFNDIDMLTVGMYGKGNVGATGCNDTDYRSQFALWCMFSSPLMIGCDIRNMTSATKNLLTNKELIKINQDPEARQPYLVPCNPWATHTKVFIKLLSNNEFAIGFFNMSDNDCNVPLFLYNAGISASDGYSVEIKDIFTGETKGGYTERINPFVKSHDCAIYRAKLIKA